MSAPSPGTEILRPSPLKWLAMGAASAGLVWIGGIIMPTHPVLAWGCIVFFGLCAAVALLNLLPGGSRLLLDADGFEMVSLLRRSRIRWAEVARFGETRVGMQRLVGFDFVECERGGERLHRINRRVSGFHGALPDTYRLDAGELARRLDIRLQAWRAPATPGA
ncbi:MULTISPECIES: hypothetical protein [unclassified Luteimonas]